MHYALFLGIFGLPVVAGVAMVIARAFSAFAPEDPRGPGGRSPDDLHGTESHVNDLVETFFAAPVVRNSKQ
jgi:hypothetical protein